LKGKHIMTNFVGFITLMATLVVGLALLSVAVAVVAGIFFRAFRGDE
jgi:hypothetical protein